MKAITFINRIIVVITGFFFLVGLLERLEGDLMIIAMLLAIPLGIFQVIASLILISYKEKMAKDLKMSLNAYHLFLLFYIILFSTILNYSLQPILFTIPVLLTLGLTVIIEITYKEIQKDNLDENKNIKGKKEE